MRDLFRAIAPRGPVLTLLLLGALAAGPGRADTITLTSAVNRAGGQHMLPQRIVKAYCLVGMGVQTGVHKRQLGDAVARFEAHLAELKAYAPGPAVLEELGKVERAWGPFKRLALAPPTREGAQKLLDLSDELRKEAQEVEALLEKVGGGELTRLVRLAGGERTRVQDLAKLYLARAWGVKDPDMEEDMRKAAEGLESALMSELMPSERNTPEIQERLAAAAKQWGTYKRGLQLDGVGDPIPVLVATSSETLFEHFDKVAGLYEQLGPK